MKTLLVIMVAVAVMLSFSMVSFAQEQKATTGNGQMTAPEKKVESKGTVMNFTGRVTAVDSTAKTIVVKNKTGEKTFDVSGATMKGEVKPEYIVHVRYSDEDGKMVASSVSWAEPKLSKNDLKGIRKEIDEEKEGM